MPRLGDDRPLSSGPTRRDKSGPPPAYPPTRGCARKRNPAAFACVNLGERFGYSGAGDDLGLPALETLIGHEWSQIGVGIDLVDHRSAPDDRMVAATKFDPANVERALKLRRKAVRANRVVLLPGDCVRHLVMIAGLDHPGIRPPLCARQSFARRCARCPILPTAYRCAAPRTAPRPTGRAAACRFS